MQVLVTGAAGHLGRHVVTALLGAGHRVHAVDRHKLPLDLPDGSRATLAELASWPGLEAAVDAAEAIVHLAAIPNLFHHPEDQVFAENTALTARLAFAAIKAGRARRFLYASSQCALGLALAPDLTAPDYLPVDEAHPVRPSEGYGLSKLVGEEFCALVSQRLGIPSLAVRLPLVWDPADHAASVARRLTNPVQTAKSNFAYIDARDAGSLFAAALEADWPGYRMVQAGADRPFAAGDIRVLAKEAYGDLPGLARLGPDSALYSIDKASALLGWQPRYRWGAEGITDNPGR